jgi:HlyD family secretion protein
LPWLDIFIDFWFINLRRTTINDNDFSVNKILSHLIWPQTESGICLMNAELSNPDPTGPAGTDNDAPRFSGTVNGTNAAEDDLPLLVRPPMETLVDSPSLFKRIALKLKFIPLIMIFGATIGIVALYFQPPGLKMLMGVLQLEPGGGTSSPIAVPAKPRPQPNATAEPAVNKSFKIIGLGRLLPKGDIRTVATPFGAGDARIATLHVEEGQTVAKGDLLASLDNEQNTLAMIESAKATVAARRASLEQIKNSVIASLEETEAQLQRAKSGLSNAGQELERARSLFDRGYTTRALLDQKKAGRDQAQGEVDRLTATLARFSASTLEEQPDIVVAARNVDATLSELRRATSDLSKTRVVAPITGTILDIFVRSGERPGTRGLLKIGNIATMTAEVEIYQTDIGRISMGAPVVLNADALAIPLKGVVSKIGLEVGTQSLVDSSPAANTDARVVKVTVTLDPESSEAANRYTNLQVLAHIEAPSG